MYIIILHINNEIVAKHTSTEWINLLYIIYRYYLEMYIINYSENMFYPYFIVIYDNM